MLTMLIFLILSYLVAALPFGVIITTLYGGNVDIRVSGSGNIGATNVARVYGWGLAGPVVTLDVLKGFVPVLVGSLIWPESGLWWASAVAVSVFVGHCFPVYLEFRGGKGVATGAGALLAVLPVPTLVAAAVWGAVLAWFGRASVAALIAAMCLVGVTIFWSPSVLPLVLLLCCGVVLTHIANIGRIVRGQEKAVIKPVRLQRSGRDADEVVIPWRKHLAARTHRRSPYGPEPHKIRCRVSRRKKSRLRTLNNEVNASVVGPPCFRAIRVDGSRLSKAFIVESICGDSSLNQEGAYRFCASIRQLQIAGIIADIIGMSLDAKLHGWAVFEYLCNPRKMS